MQVIRIHVRTNYGIFTFKYRAALIWETIPKELKSLKIVLPLDSSIYLNGTVTAKTLSNQKPTANTVCNTRRTTLSGSRGLLFLPLRLNPGGFPWESLVRVCRPVLQILTPFQSM